MKKSIVGVLVFILGMPCYTQTASHEFHDEGFLANRRLSKLSFIVGEPFHLHDRSLNVEKLRCDLSSMTLAKYPTQIPLLFKSGRAQKVMFDLTRRDSVTNIFTLSRTIRQDSENIADMRGVGVLDSSGNPVDIASLVRREIDSVQTTDEASWYLTGIVEDFDFQIVPFGVAIAFSLIGTIALMLWTTKRTPSKQKPLPIAAIVTEKKIEPKDTAGAILGQARIILREKTARPRHRSELPEREHIESEPDSELSNEEESQMINQMRRVSLELELEKRLRARQNNRRDSIALAKKLGIGRGELELAASLRKMNEKQ